MLDQDRKVTLADVSAIKIDNPAGTGFTMEGKSNDTLMGTKLINIFIGENSAGKSRFLRTLLIKEFKQFEINSSYKYHLKNIIRDRINTAGLLNTNEIHYANILHEKIESELNVLLNSNLLTYLWGVIKNEMLNTNGSSSEYEIRDFLIKIMGNDILDKLNFIDRQLDNFKIILKKRQYIPILRGLRPLVETDDTYQTRTHNDYFKKTNEKVEIYTGYSLYSDLVYSLLGMESERKNVKQFENYLSLHFFEGKSVTLIPKKDREESKEQNDVVYIKIGDETMLPIYQLGDGIQALIILTVRPFLTTEPTMFFIEEPEQHLHAGMQRALINALRACPQHKYFFTTQSNHFIDLSIESHDIALFSVKKTLDDNNKANSTIINQHDRSEILKDLGVLASSVLLANCSVWVEGITDKLYLRIYLNRFINNLEIKSKSESLSIEEREVLVKRYQKLRSLNENLHYVFVEYQGSNITHWNFSDDTSENDTPAKKLCHDIFLLADQDISQKGTRTDDLEKALSKHFHLLDRKEIENYIPAQVITETAKKCWENFNGKADSILDENKLSELCFKDKTIGIGKILEPCIIRGNDVKTERKFFEDKSGTIKDKVKFCETACTLMQSGDIEWELTPELDGLCNKIWAFIEESNKAV
ncbi:ATP-dependent nuclease [Morganella psychrotolerans]|uniref:ATP-dependent nuclease n=1 Tax=Morganella psychrotolerans TaxID=368603 RepID=UPI0039AF2AF2